MDAVRFKGLDLNLLVAFDALIATRSVSRAAEQLNLSQPAVSAALGRLREYFGDPILVIHGKRMLPTAHAESLLPQVQECLRSAEALVATSTSFDPRTSQRVFRLVASDFATTAILVPLVRQLAVIAPTVRIEIRLPDEMIGSELDQGKVDLIITPEEFCSGSHPVELLFEEQHVVAGCRTNPLFAAPLTEEGFFASGHVAVSIGRHRQTAFGDQHLESLGRQRRIEVVAASFSVVPLLLIETPRLALMHERLAAVMAARFPIAHAPMPFTLPVMREMLQYHHARAADDGLRWLRDRLREIAIEDPSV